MRSWFYSPLLKMIFKSHDCYGVCQGLSRRIDIVSPNYGKTVARTGQFLRWELHEPLKCGCSINGKQQRYLANHAEEQLLPEELSLSVVPCSIAFGFAKKKRKKQLVDTRSSKVVECNHSKTDSLLERSSCTANCTTHSATSLSSLLGATN